MSISAYLLDIEGTTTPINFVTDVLFPYARVRLAEFVQSNNVDEETTALFEEYSSDVQSGNSPPSPFNALQYLYWLMDHDRKSATLKSIQGRIWESGYLDGSLKGELFDDVRPAMERWIQAGASISIFSSGSVLAQKLLFQHSVAGDLTGMIRSYFDTTTGGKRDPKSYELIAKTIGIDPSNGLFLSDIFEEVSAARQAGWNSQWVARNGSASNADAITDFSTL